MNSPARPSRITVDLGEYKAPWLAYCKRHDTTVSEAFRVVVAKLIAAPAPEAGSDAVHGNMPGRGKIRKEVRLTPIEVARIEAIAAADGYSLTRWINALIRSRLDGGPQLGQHELSALGKSNLQLLAIGRNINQIARAVNNGNRDLLPLLEPVLGELRGLITTHTVKVAQLLEHNLARWSTS